MSIYPDQQLGPVDEATPIGHCAVEAACVHHCLDDRHIPRADSKGETYSLWGRVEQYKRQQAFTNGPAWSDIAASAYRAYSASTSNKNFRGEPMPAWSDLPQAIRTAWDAACRQVNDVLLDWILSNIGQDGNRLI